MRLAASVPWLTTLLVHAALVLLALAWVVSTALAPPPAPEPETFVVAGGGLPAPKVGPSRPERRPAAPSVPSRLTVQGGVSSLAVAALPEASLGLPSGLSGPGLASSAVASPGRAGLGAGPGGGAPGRIGLPVLGLRVQARRLAVYLDSSGSMRPHLARIEGEIRASFPEADVFRFDGARIVVHDGRVAEGRGYDGPSQPRRPGATDPATLTAEGRRLLERLAPRCEAGSLGAWIDWMIEERYDALIVFSDFQDGIRVYRDPGKGPPELVYADSKRRQVDERGAGDDRWRRRWLERFALAPSGRAPRLYLLTSEVSPQAFLRDCAVASGGGLTMVEVGRPKPAR